MAQVNIRNRKKKDGTNSWEYRFEIASVDGKRKAHSKGGFRTKAEALAAGNKALAEYNASGQTFEPSEISVSDYMDLWFETYCKPNLRYGTLTGYAGIIENHIKPAFGHYKLRALTPTICQEWVNKLHVNGGLTRSTINGITVLFSSALFYAVEPLKLISSSPMEYVRTPRNTSGKHEGDSRTVISKEDYARIIERFEGHMHFKIAIMIGWYTGMRIGEVFGLTWDDIDFENGIIHVRRQITKRPYGNGLEIKGHQQQQRSVWYVSPLKTDASERDVKIGDTLLSELAAFKARQESDRQIYGEYYTDQILKPDSDEKGNTIYRLVPCERSISEGMEKINLIMRQDNGEYVSTDSFKYASRIIHHELHLTFQFHCLRHTHGTMLIEAGVPVKTVQTRLGHKDIQTTLQTYVHTTEGMEDAAVDAFENIMK